MSVNNIYVAEAYNRYGIRVERIAHTTREGAKEDIEVHAESETDDLLTNVCPLELCGDPEEWNGKYVYVGEVHNRAGQRVERVAHTTPNGAGDDTAAYVSRADGTIQNCVTSITPLKLHRGPEATETAVATNPGP